MVHKKRMHFFTRCIFNLYSKVILRELDVLLGYIIGMNEIAGNHKQHIKGKGGRKRLSIVRK